MRTVIYCGACLFGWRIMYCEKPVKKRISDQRVIISIVASVFDVSIAAMVAKSRGVIQVTDAKHTAMWFIRRRNPKMSLETIGGYFNKTHATVISALLKVDSIKYDREYKKKFTQCQELINDYFKK